MSAAHPPFPQSLFLLLSWPLQPLGLFCAPPAPGKGLQRQRGTALTSPCCHYLGCLARSILKDTCRVSPWDFVLLMSPELLRSWVVRGGFSHKPKSHVDSLGGLVPSHGSLPPWLRQCLLGPSKAPCPLQEAETLTMRVPNNHPNALSLSSS